MNLRTIAITLFLAGCAPSIETLPVSTGSSTTGSGGSDQGGASSETSSTAGAGGSGGAVDFCDPTPLPPPSDDCTVIGEYLGACDFGADRTCPSSPFGYYCPSGGPPPVPGCLARSADGSAYCCAVSVCVRYSTNDAACAALTADAQPVAYSCPSAEPTNPGLPAGCVSAGNEYDDWCCPAP